MKGKNSRIDSEYAKGLQLIDIPWNKVRTRQYRKRKTHGNCIQLFVDFVSDLQSKQSLGKLESFKSYCPDAKCLYSHDGELIARVAYSALSVCTRTVAPVQLCRACTCTSRWSAGLRVPSAHVRAVGGVRWGTCMYGGHMPGVVHALHIVGLGVRFGHSVWKKLAIPAIYGRKPQFRWNMAKQIGFTVVRKWDKAAYSLLIYTNYIRDWQLSFHMGRTDHVQYVSEQHSTL